MDGSVNLRQETEAELDERTLEATPLKGVPMRRDCNSRIETSRDFPLTAVWVDLRDVRLKADKQ